ncbi:MAG: hypothetical protein PPP58_07545 [Natronomonas sp.]
MRRRVLLGAAATFLVAVGAIVGGVATETNPVGVVLAAGLVGGFLVGVLSTQSGHVGDGARAGGYGGGVAFLGFVAVGLLQSLLDGDLSVLVIGVETVLIALVVVPIHAISGGVAAGIGRWLRRRGTEGDTEPT